jgi:N-acetylglucosamine-6-phosphate deacetylase
VTLSLAGRVLTGRGLAAGEVGVADGRIAAGAPRRARRALPEGWIVAPGMVDLQVNGYAGAEADAGPEALAAIAAALPAAGVTAFCPTLVSRPEGGYRRAAAAMAGCANWPPRAWPIGTSPAARVLPPHLEGPFLAPGRAGVHPVSALRDPSPEAVDRLLDAFAPAVVTLAPERPGALEAIGRIARRGVVASVGHTAADARAGRAAIEAGARLMTHALNAMDGIASRRPSALAAFLADPRPGVSLIADGVHVAPEVAAVVARAAGRRLVLVSDAVAPAGAPPGRYRLGRRTIVSDGHRVEWRGRLAGSALGLDEGPRTLRGAGIGAGAALAAATAAPRRLLGLPAGLARGDPADLVVLDPALTPHLTLVGGVVAHADPALPFDVPEVGSRV